MALAARKFKRPMRRKNPSFKKNPYKGKANKDKKKDREGKPICFECKMSRYFKIDCP